MRWSHSIETRLLSRPATSRVDSRGCSVSDEVRRDHKYEHRSPPLSGMRRPKNAEDRDTQKIRTPGRKPREKTGHPISNARSWPEAPLDALLHRIHSQRISLACRTPQRNAMQETVRQGSILWMRRLGVSVRTATCLPAEIPGLADGEIRATKSGALSLVAAGHDHLDGAGCGR
mgnify:CR=1 FL=1